jgi:hypothetical protein
MLQFPIPVPLRIAVLEKGFALDRNSREFEPGDLAGIRAWNPEAMVAPLQAALAFADLRLRGVLDLPDLAGAIIVLTDRGGEPLAEHHRELLWRAFGIPLFEQMRGRDGMVIARECEVHDGLHVDPAFAGEWKDTELVAEPCDCGSEAPRVRKYISTRLPNALGTWNVVAPVGRQAA